MYSAPRHFLTQNFIKKFDTNLISFFSILIFIFAIPAYTQDQDYLKYGTHVTYNYNHMGHPGMGSSSVIRKMFSRCHTKGEEEYCSSAQWIGFTGENLASAVQSDETAYKTAKFIRITTLVQVLSVVATPVFLFSGIAQQEEKVDSYGDKSFHIPASGIFLIAMAGASFLNYIGWNIAEGVIARKAIKQYNESIKTSLHFSINPKSFKLSYNF